jgi:hypothetical protein
VIFPLLSYANRKPVNLLLGVLFASRGLVTAFIQPLTCPTRRSYIISFGTRWKVCFRHLAVDLLSNDYPDLFQSLSRASATCREALDSLHSYANAPSSSGGPPLPTILTDFKSILSFIYSHSTTLSLALKPPPTLEAAVKPLAELSADVARLTACALLLNAQDHGKTLRREVVWAAQEIVDAIQALVSGFSTADNGKQILRGKDDKTYLLKMGSLHSSIDKIKADLSSDNASAVAKSWAANDSAIADAVRESKEMAEDEEEEGDGGWDEAFRDENVPHTKTTAEEIERTKKVMTWSGIRSHALLTHPQVHRLLRLVSLLHRRILTHHLSVKPTPSNLQLAELLARSSDIASSADEIVSSLYSPQDPVDVVAKARMSVDAADTLRKAFVAADLAERMTAATLDDRVPPIVVTDKDLEWIKSCTAQITKAFEALP